MVPLEAFDVTQIKISKTKAPRSIARRKPEQPVCNNSILITELALIAITGLANRKKLAGKTYADHFMVN